jgi:hypothetical protein
MSDSDKYDNINSGANNEAYSQFFGVPPGDNHRAHVPVIYVIQMELLLQQANILIHAYLLLERRGVDLDVLLSDGLDESHLREPLLQAAHEGEGRRRFAHVLFGRGDEDWPRSIVIAR